MPSTYHVVNCIHILPAVLCKMNGLKAALIAIRNANAICCVWFVVWNGVQCGRVCSGVRTVEKIADKIE